MNMIALNNTNTTQPRLKRATVKGKVPLNARYNSVELPKPKAENKPVKPSANQSSTAKRLVNTKNLSHDKWLEVRKQGIGSSDAAAACGIHPFLSMLELWMIKTGRMASNIDASNNNGIDGYSPLYWGNTLRTNGG